MKVNLSISPEEAYYLRSALEFVQSNSTLEPSAMQMKFREGKQFASSIQGWLGLGYVIAKIEESVNENSNRVHFAGFLNSF